LIVLGATARARPRFAGERDLARTALVPDKRSGRGYDRRQINEAVYRPSRGLASDATADDQMPADLTPVLREYHRQHVDAPPARTDEASASGSPAPRAEVRRVLESARSGVGACGRFQGDGLIGHLATRSRA
jgi:hypothetical protein